MRLRIVFNPITAAVDYVSRVLVRDHGVDEGDVDVVDFTGAGVGVSYVNGVATVNIPGGAANADQLLDWIGL